MYANPQLLLSCLVLQSTTTGEQKNHCSRVLLKAVGEGSLLPGSIQQTKQKKQKLSQLSNICNKMFPWSLCSDRISAVGFPCDLWTSTRTTQKHLSGVRRRSVSAYYTGMMTGVWVPNIFIKKKKKVQLCTLVIPRPGGRDRRISHSAWTTKKTPGAVGVSTPKHAWHTPLVSMHPYTCAHTHSHAHTEVHVWNTVPRPFKSEPLGMIPKILNFRRACGMVPLNTETWELLKCNTRIAKMYWEHGNSNSRMLESNVMLWIWNGFANELLCWVLDANAALSRAGAFETD